MNRMMSEKQSCSLDKAFVASEFPKHIIAERFRTLIRYLAVQRQAVYWHCRRLEVQFGDIAKITTHRRGMFHHGCDLRLE